MKKLLLGTILLSMTVHAESFTDYATITKVNPILETVLKPEKVCATQNKLERIDNHSYGGAIVGGGIGAVLGHQIGKGRGKDVATAVGAIAGAMIGDNVDNVDNNPQYENKQIVSCETQNKYVKVITGYEVQYNYKGRVGSFVSQSEQTVGTRLTVNVSVDPVN